MNPARKTIIVLGVIMVAYSVYFLFFFRGGNVHSFGDLFSNKEVIVLLVGILFLSTLLFKKEY